jgi:hypothetical protein
MVTLDHQVVRQEGAVIAYSASLDGLEEGLAILVLLLDELRVVVEFIERCRNGQQRRVGKLEHGYDRLIEQIK